MTSISKPFFALLIALFTITGCSDANVPQEGDKYTIIPTPMTDTADVIEIFSLGCGHCRNMEAMLPELQSMAKVDIEKVHVTFNEGAQLAAYIFYTAAIQTSDKPSEQLVKDLFAYVQDSDENLSPEEKRASLEKIFKQYDLLSPYELSEEQHKTVYQQLSAAETLVANAEVASVPAFLVKGKYLIQTDAHESLEDIANTIRYLNTQVD
ncbi:thiol:disulfide interchange protein DsbA/DsbL [Photobacterium sagamiensis]|uniref:thiol:disulfide interchange protein DsbA/DsbL n=1 Tax=Photobacterium sagamiensis TaxID=2910241 RepID=UPI003D11575E